MRTECSGSHAAMQDNTVGAWNDLVFSTVCDAGENIGLCDRGCVDLEQV